MTASSEELDITPTDLQGWEGDATARAGRTQLSSQFKANLKRKLARATGEEEEAFDFRSLNSSAQTTRATSESLGARGAARRRNKTWVFLARVSESEDKVKRTLFEKLGQICSVAVLFSRVSGWQAYSIMHHPLYKDLARSLAIALNVDAEKVEEFKNFDLDDLDDVAVSGEVPITLPEDVFVGDGEFEAIIRNIERKKSVILSGPPGTGKTFVADRIATALLKDVKEQSLTRIQFHPSFSYEEFVRGWRPSESGFALKDGVLLRIAMDASDDPDSRHVLIIDEINRANVTKVFGEALSLVEATKRGPMHGVSLSYAKDAEEGDTEVPFFLPSNVYIIGTMNTADRSIAMVDFALRRRFSFFYIKPAFESEKFRAALGRSGVPTAAVDSLCSLMVQLNEAIVNDNALGKGYEVGHSYFVSRKKIEFPAQWLSDVINTEIAPLLHEYWFEDESVAESWTRQLNDLLEMPCFDSDAAQASNEDSN